MHVSQYDIKYDKMPSRDFSNVVFIETPQPFETRYVPILLATFPEFRFSHKQVVNEYRVDLYSHVLKLAIDIDKLGYDGYRKSNDNVRTQTIKETLGCEFFRFDPTPYDFNIGEVILKLRKIAKEKGVHL